MKKISHFTVGLLCSLFMIVTYNNLSCVEASESTITEFSNDSITTIAMETTETTMSAETTALSTTTNAAINAGQVKDFYDKSGMAICSYKIEDDEVTIVSCEWRSYLKDVVLPEEIEGYPVTKIAKKAMYRNENYTSVTLPETLITIEDEAIMNCKNIKEITIPKSVQKIGEHAVGFESVESIKFPYQLYIPCGMVLKVYKGTVGETYAKNNNFTFVVLDDESDVTTTAAAATEITTSTTVTTSVKQNTYENLTYSEYEDHIEIIGCDQTATEVVIPDRISGLPVTNLAEDAFKYCRNLVEVKLPNTLKIIPRHCFENSFYLESIDIPNGVEIIEPYAFSDCKRLKSVDIPESVSIIYNFAFNECENLESVYIRSKNVKFIGSQIVCQIGSLTFSNYVTEYNSIYTNYVYNGVIYGYEESDAQEYADSRGIKFKILNDEPVITTAVTTTSEITSTTVSPEKTTEPTQAATSTSMSATTSPQLLTTTTTTIGTETTLPQTGYSIWYQLLAALALGMIGIGSAVIVRSGVFRKTI